MKEGYFKANTSVTSKPMIKVSSMVRDMVKMSLNQETESYITNCVSTKLIDVKMQLGFDPEDVNTEPDRDGPIQLEFENGKILHIGICHKNGIEIHETPMHKEKVDGLFRKNISLKDDKAIVDLIGNRLTDVSIITKEWVKANKKHFKTRYIICGIVLQFSNKESLIYIHEKKGIPRVNIYKKIDVSRYKIHKYIWEDPIKRMTKKEFHEIISDVPVDQKWEAIEKVDTSLKWEVMGGVDTSLLNEEVFDLLVDQLKDKEDGTRFFALFTLIDKFRERLSNANDALADLMIQLLNDPYSLVVDRASWALTIMGEVGLKKLFKNINSDDPEFRRRIFLTIGKSAHLNAEKSIEVFVEGLKDKNEEIRYIAMSTLMEISPLGQNDSKTIEDFDFTTIYKMIKPVAKSFIESNNEEYRNFAGISFMRIKEEEEKW